MPYIKPKGRKRFDLLLQDLWDELAMSGVEPNTPTIDQMKGNVNYCFTKILVTMLEKFGARYHNLSNIAAIPQDVHDEFKAMFMRPYEDEKKLENGEVKPLKVVK